MVGLSAGNPGVDNVTIEYNENLQLEVKDGSITDDKLATTFYKPELIEVVNFAAEGSKNVNVTGYEYYLVEFQLNSVNSDSATLRMRINNFNTSGRYSETTLTGTTISTGTNTSMLIGNLQRSTSLFGTINISDLVATSSKIVTASINNQAEEHLLEGYIIYTQLITQLNFIPSDTMNGVIRVYGVNKK